MHWGACAARLRVRATRMIAIVDYGMGNLRSVAKAIEHVAPRESVRITSDANEVRSAARVVFPGQGAMPDCMRYLHDSGLEPAVREDRRPDPTREISELLECLLRVASRLGEEQPGSFGVVSELLLCHAEAHAECHQPCLRSVVQVTLDPPQLRLLEVDCACPRLLELFDAMHAATVDHCGVAGGE